jgi:arylesterase / paraoxonase
MVKKLIIGLCALIALVAAFLIKTVYDAGQFRTLHAHSDYTCVKVKLACPEDIEIDAEGGMALISSSDRRAAMRGETTQGGIYGYSLLAKNPEPVNLTADFKKEFHPHGISLYLDPSGRRYLFVVNMGHDAHFFDAGKKNRVEIFEYAGGRLLHRETVSGDILQTPNDILGVGPRQFYFTNDHGARSPLGKKLETYLQLALSNIVYYDGRGFTVAAGDLVYANGLAMTGDGKTLYATSTVGKLLRVYDRDAASGRLRKIRDVPLDTGVDNINVDREGRIWAGCMPKLLSFVSYTKDPSKLAPSQVLTITGGAKGGYAIREVYLDNGEGISGCSSAAGLGNRMLVGASYDDHFLDCTLKR